jgi:hypothetical protein
MNLFLAALGQQCDRCHLPAEVVLVEWNPVEDRPLLSDALRLPEAGGMLSLRVITVPPEIHCRFRYADGLPLYQMIGKNAGIRRARGEFILATNVDILFSEEVVRYLASDAPARGGHYRVDRFDVDLPVPRDLDGLGTEALLNEFRRNLLRVNRREGTLNYRTGGLNRVYPERGETAIARLHTNACGDFALTHRDHWFATLGYPEIDIFSMHLDSLWLYNATFSELEERYLPPPMAVFHIEHSGGWVAERKKEMLDDLKVRQVPTLSYNQLASMAWRITQRRRPIRFNTPSWGLAEESLPDEIIVPAGWEVPPGSPPLAVPLALEAV